LNRSHSYVVLATVGFSFILIFSTFLKLSGMSSFEQLSFRLSFASVILLCTMFYRRKSYLTKMKDVPFFVLIGFTYALFALSGLSSISFGTPIAVSVALVYTQPIFTALISFLTRKERVSVVRAAVVLVGVLGAFLVSGLNAVNPKISIGIIFPVLAGFLYAIYLWLKRQAPIDEYTPFGVLSNTFLFALPLLLAVWFLARNFSEEPLFIGIVMPNWHQLVLLFFFALFSTVLPYGLLNFVKVGEVSPTVESVLLLGDPLLHALWATLFFSQFISGMQYLGAALILASAILNLRFEAKSTS
jgi:drug/metabolite transporter (DMT)-like permease